MNELPRETLCQIIARHGHSLIDDPGRCEGLLRDSCGTYKREISVLIVALRGHVAHDLLAASDGMPWELLVTRLAKRLEDHLALQPEAAKWAVETWALALGRISKHPPPSSAQLRLSMPTVNFVGVNVNSGIEKRFIEYENETQSSLQGSITSDAPDFLKVIPTTLLKDSGQIEVNLDTGRLGWSESYFHNIVITYNGPDSPIKIPVTVRVRGQKSRSIAGLIASAVFGAIFVVWIGSVAYWSWKNRNSEEPAPFPSAPAPATVLTQCSRAFMALNSVARGTLTDSSCEAPNHSASKADLYSFTGVAGQQVTIIMSSDTFDTYLVLVGPDGQKVEENDDMFSGLDNYSMISKNLPASGTYVIEATSSGSTERGGYNLRLSNCRVRWFFLINKSWKLTGNLTESECEAPDRPGSKAEMYTFFGFKGDREKLEMASTEFDTYLILTGPDGKVVASNDDIDGNVNKNSRVEVPLSSTGIYTVEATAFDKNGRGSYNLERLGPRCAWSLITRGEKDNYILTTNDCQGPHRSEGKAKAKLYTFWGKAGQRVTINMNSSDFDTYLILVGPDGDKVADNDDVEPQKNTNSRIETKLLKTGLYTIEATAFDEKRLGNYDLLLQ